MHLGLGSSSSSNSATKEAQQNEAKEARRLVREYIRTDWHYPPLPAYLTDRDVEIANAGLTSQTTLSALQPEEDEVEGEDEPAQQQFTVIGGFKVHQGLPQSLIEQVVPEITGWTQRYYASSDSEDESGAPAKLRSRTEEELSPYLFEGPDTVGTQLSGRAQVRKRKRQMVLAEEMEWNDGLKHFITRRDLWTGAKTIAQLEAQSASKLAVSTAAEAYNASETSSPRSSTSMKTDATLPSRPSTATTSPDPQAMATIKTPFPTLPDMLVPSMSRLLTKHPVRRKIGPTMYSEIYTKIIAQSRTPAVPINLLHLIRSCVQGWKDEGEWPPKINVPEPSMARKKAHGLKQGVRAMTRVLKITSSADAAERKLA